MSAAVLSALCLAATAALTRPLIGLLRARELGKAIRADGPAHGAKAGTPTMGGLAALAVLGVALAFLWWSSMRYGDANGARASVVALAAMIAFGALGLHDDLEGLARRSGRRELGVGLGARRMIGLQLVAAVAIWLVAGRPEPWPTAGIAPLAGALSVLAVVGTVNGVNLSDGLDGLAAGLLALAFVSLSAIAALAGTPAAAAAALAAAGACLGFLWHNRHPARVFMGNVTSMALGAVLAVLAWHVPFGVALLPILGAVFVAEVLSDVLQVAWYKATGGRRILRMAPLHHHFEAGGLHETTVVTRFWLAGAAFGLAAVAWRLAAGGAP